MPPMTPGSAVSVIRSMIFSSLATLGQALGHADAEVDDAVGHQLERRAAGDDLALAHRHRRDRAHRHADLAGERRAVRLGERLPMILRPSATTTQSTRMPGILTWRGLRLPRSAMRSTCDDDDAAGVVRRHGDGEHFQRERLAFHRDVAVGIGGRAADDPDVDRERLVEQVVVPPIGISSTSVLGRAR